MRASPIPAAAVCLSRRDPSTWQARRWRRLSPLCVLMVATACESPSPTEHVEEPVSVTVVPSTVSLLEGERVQLAVNVQDAAGEPVSDARVRFSSSNPLVVWPTSLGMLIAFQPGTAYVEAQTDRGKALVTVTVERRLSRLEIWMSPRIGVGSSELLFVESLDWHGRPMAVDLAVRSSDESVASVRRRADVSEWAGPNAHEVSGLSEGEVTIIAESGEVTAAVTLTVGS
jgi:hypothetical protein